MSFSYTIQVEGNAFLIEFSFLMQVLLITLSVERLMGVFFEKRKAPLLAAIGSYALFFIVCYLSTTLPADIFGIFGIFIAALPYFVISLNYEGGMVRRLVASVSSFLCIQIVRAILVVGTFVIPNSHEVLTAEAALLLLFINGLLTYVIASLLRKFRNIKKSAVSSPASWVLLILVPLFSMAILMISFSVLDELPQWVIVAISMMVMGIVGFSLNFQNIIAKMYEDKLNSALHLQEKEFYLAQCLMMQESIEKVKSVRHDMKSHLAVLRDYTADNKAAAEYINHLLGKIEESEAYSDTGNVTFDSIINYKLRNAIDDNIKTEINVFVPTVINIDAVDVITILGNLLDNALDAVAKVENRMINLDIAFDKGGLLIKLDNTFDGAVNYTEAPGGERIITTAKDGEHGHGLKNIRKSVEKYNGYIDITHEGNIFSVGVLLYVNDPQE